MQPRVSIILTSFNYGRFIGETIESVLAQTYDAWELIIVDDCSSDDSWDVISRYRDERIRAVRFEKNQGACAAYGAAYNLAQGEFIASLDSDDIFLEFKLARQIDYMDAHPEIDICGTFLHEINDAGRDIAPEKRLYEPWFNKDLDLNDPAVWIWENHLCHSSTVIRKATHDSIGQFRADLTYTPDWNFWIRALVKGARFHVIPERLVKYRVHDRNITHSNAIAVTWEYAEFSGAVFHPFLRRIGRLDLIFRNAQIFLRRFFDHESDWTRFLELINVLQPPVDNAASYKINPAAFENDDFARMVLRLAHGYMANGSVEVSTMEGGAQASEYPAKIGRLEQEIAHLTMAQYALQSASRSLVSERDGAIGRAERLQNALVASELDLQNAREEMSAIQAELDRLRCTVWGKADRFFNKAMR